MDTKSAKTTRFKAPTDPDWQSLQSESDGDTDSEKRNQERLDSALLESLQMQNLVVLAGSGCSLSAGAPSMGDLWNSAVGDPVSEDAVYAAKKVNHDLGEKNIEELLSRVEAALKLKYDECLARFLRDSKSVILESCTQFIETDQLGVHRTLLHRLSRRRVRDQRLKIFTTNYDVCFERAAGLIGGVTIDGFSFSSPRHYDPRYFGYDLVRRSHQWDESVTYVEGVFLLYKLHGSVNWARKPDGSVVEESEPSPDEACLIYPANGKYQQSYTQPYIESMASFLSAVRQPNTCIVVTGFGFNDDHLSEPLLAAVKSNPHIRLIVADPKASRQDNSYWNELDKLREQGDDIWFLEANFEQLASLVPDLKSLTPADSLFRAVQGAARQS